MKIDQLFSNLWFVYNDGKFDTMWTKRDEARSRKASLRSQNSSNVTIAKLSVSYSDFSYDKKS